MTAFGQKQTFDMSQKKQTPPQRGLSCALPSLRPLAVGHAEFGQAECEKGRPKSGRGRRDAHCGFGCTWWETMSQRPPIFS